MAWKQQLTAQFKMRWRKRGVKTVSKKNGSLETDDRATSSPDTLCARQPRPRSGAYGLVNLTSPIYTHTQSASGAFLQYGLPNLRWMDLVSSR